MEDIGDQRPKEFHSSIVVSSTDGWITPGGNFYACTDTEHDAAAEYLFKSKRSFIQGRLERDGKYGLLHDVKVGEPNARMVLQAAGFALLSNGIMAEQNLPEELSTRQLELMRRSNLAFTPESGRLEPSVYLEFKDWLLKVPGIQEAQEALIKECDYSDPIDEINTFFKSPSQALGISNSYGSYQIGSRAEELFDTITGNNSKEVVLKLGVRRDTITWRKISLPSGSHVFVQFKKHEHNAHDDDTTEDYVISLVSGKRIQEFLTNVERWENSSIKGDLNILK